MTKVGTNEAGSKGGRPRTGSWRRVSATDLRVRIEVTLPSGKRTSAIIAGSEKWSDDTATKRAKYASDHPDQWRDLVGQPAPDEPQGETLADYSERWLADRELRGLSSIRHYRSHIKVWVPAELRAKPMVAITTADLEGLVASLDRSVLAGELSWRTAAKVWGTLSKMFDDAKRAKEPTLRALKSNPAADVPGPYRGVSKAKQYLWPSEFSALVRCDAPLRWRRLYALAVYLYVRPGELEALTWDAVDLDHGIVHVHQSIDRDRRQIKATKTDEARRIPIDPTLMPLLRAMHAESKGQGFVASMPPMEDLAGTMRDHLRRAGCKRADLYADSKTTKRITFYDLRATGITWAIMRGDGPAKVQYRAGHAEFSTTQQYIREAENLAAGFGEPFPALPAELLGVSADRFCAEFSAGLLTGLDSETIPVELLASPAGFEPALQP